MSSSGKWISRKCCSGNVYLQAFSENVLKRSCGLLTIFVENLQKVVGNLRKIISMFTYQRKKYMVACRYGISLLVFNFISHSFAALTSEISG